MPFAKPVGLMLMLAAVFPLLPSAEGAIVMGSKDIGSIWFIGDSITEAVADGNANSSPRTSLYNDLTAAGYVFNYTGSRNTQAGGLPVTGDNFYTNLYQYHTGISGVEIQGITNSLGNLWNTERLAYVKPNVIIILLGTNDIDHGITPAAAAARMTLLLDGIYALPGVGNPTVLVGGIPPNGGSVDKNNNVMAFNNLLPDVVQSFYAAGKDVYFVDQYTGLDGNRALYMQDNLHTNTFGNDLLAQGWFDAIDGLVAIPEPATYALLGFGLVGAALAARFGRIRKTTDQCKCSRS
jgi:lysophospholipase L1-like esterase